MWSLFKYRATNDSGQSTNILQINSTLITWTMSIKQLRIVSSKPHVYTLTFRRSSIHGVHTAQPRSIPTEPMEKEETGRSCGWSWSSPPLEGTKVLEPSSLWKRRSHKWGMLGEEKWERRRACRPHKDGQSGEEEKQMKCWRKHCTRKIHIKGCSNKR